MYNFQHANVTQIIPTQNPNNTPFSRPKYIEPKCALNMGGKINIPATIKYLYMKGGLLK